MEEAFEVVGTNGKFQKILIFYILSTVFVAHFLNITLPLFFKSPAFMCRSMNESVLLPFHECHKENLCKRDYEYEINTSESLINFALQFDVYCEKRYIVGVASSLYFFGGMFSYLTFAQFPDIYGRRKVALIMYAAMFINLLTLIYTFNIFVILVNYFIGGALAFNNALIGLYTFEMIEQKTASVVMSLSNTVFPIGGIAVAVYFIFFKEWYYVLYAVLVMSAIVLYLIYFYLSESPRWLKSKLKLGEAVEEFRLIARINGTTEAFEDFYSKNKEFLTDFGDKVSKKSEARLSGNDNNVQDAENSSAAVAVSDDVKIEFMKEDQKKKDQEPMTEAEFQNTLSNTGDKNYNVFEIIGFPSQKMTFLILFYNWFYNGIGFYGFFLNIEELGDNVILNTILLFVSEAISEFGSGILANSFGRVSVLKYSCYLAFVSFLLLHFYIDNFIIKIIAIFTCGLGTSGSFNVSYVYTPEVFPTIIRSTAFSSLVLISRFGAFVVPTIAHFVKQTFLLFAILALVNAVLVGRLKETLGEKMPDSLPELSERMSRLSRLSLNKLATD